MFRMPLTQDIPAVCLKNTTSCRTSFRLTCLGQWNPPIKCLPRSPNHKAFPGIQFIFWGFHAPFERSTRTGYFGTRSSKNLVLIVRSLATDLVLSQSARQFRFWHDNEVVEHKQYESLCSRLMSVRGFTAEY